MNGTAFDENAHDDDENDAKEYAYVPIVGDPLLNGVQRMLVEE